jgi:hypothetical protein
MALPPTATLYQWARGRRPPGTRSYFRDLAQHWQPVSKRVREGKHAPKNYLGLHWQGRHVTMPRERAAYQMMKKG